MLLAGIIERHARGVALGAAAALSVLIATGPALASGGTTYPVPYTFVPDIFAGGNGPDASPPGANDWSCRPDAAHPYPVVLVHGLFANEADNWQTYAPLLADSGYCVFALTYGNDPSRPAPFNGMGGMAPMEQSAQVLGNFVDKVLAATKSPKVDLVGHSEGATMPYWYLKFDGGAAKVAKMIGLSPVVHGTDIAGNQMLDALTGALGLPNAFELLESSTCQACGEFNPDSAFIHQLDQGGIAAPGVTYTQIMTEFDELVVPYSNGTVDAPNSTNIVIQAQCPADLADHLAIAVDPAVARDVLNALDPAHAQPVTCSPVVPVLGAPLG